MLQTSPHMFSGPKTILENQQVHLGLLLILVYWITKENMNSLRINASDHSEIVINSPEV
jgi:hypothetical protein